MTEIIITVYSLDGCDEFRQLFSAISEQYRIPLAFDTSNGANGIVVKLSPDDCRGDIAVFDGRTNAAGMCRMAIVRERQGLDGDIGEIMAENVLSCGIGGKATLTASGLTESSIMLCVQRDIDLGDRIIEAQDIPVECGKYSDEFRAIAASAALLIAGAEFY